MTFSSTLANSVFGLVTDNRDGSTGGITTGAGLTTVANNAVADSSENNSLKAVVTDANGNPFSGAVVSFSAENGASIQQVELR